MKICMVVPDADVKGGIASVVNGYRSFDFGEQYQITYVESYRNGSKLQKLLKALNGYRLLSKNTLHLHIVMEEDSGNKPYSWSGI